MGVWTGTVPSLLSGELPDATKFAAIHDELDAIQAVWTAYVPVWTAVSVNPAKGNGTLTGKYRQVGKSVDALIILTCGTTTTFGTGEWRFSLPATAASTDQVGVTYIFDNGTQTRPGVCHMISTTTVAPDSATGTCTSIVPQTWANLDQCVIKIHYEAA